MPQVWPNTIAIHDISALDKPCKHCAYACHKKLNTSKKQQVTVNLYTDLRTYYVQYIQACTLTI